jgi:heme-degrading monooxygenase HmoA
MSLEKLKIRIRWETDADMTAGESSGHYGQQLAKFKDIFAAPPVRDGYEVSVRP